MRRITRREFLVAAGARHRRGLGAPPGDPPVAARAPRADQRGGSAGRLPGSRLGVRLPRPVSLRPDLHLRLLAERHAFVPAAGGGPQRRRHADRAGVRRVALCGPLRQHRDRRLASARAARRATRSTAGSTARSGSSTRSSGRAGRSGRTTASRRSNPELRTKYRFDARGSDELVRASWDDAHRYMAKALVAIARTYSGDDGRARLEAEGYPPEMLDAMGGAGTRTLKFRGGMGLLGVIGKYGMYRFANMMALLDVEVRGVGAEEAKGGRLWSNYTWHGDQAPGLPFVHGLQSADVDFNDLRFSQADDPGRQEPRREQDGRLPLLHRDDGAGRDDRHDHAGVQPAGDEGGLLDPDPARDRCRPLPRDHPADDRSRTVRRRLRAAVHGSPAPHPNGHRPPPARGGGLPRLSAGALEQGLARVAEGDLHVELEVLRDDEVGQLKRHFQRYDPGAAGSRRRTGPVHGSGTTDRGRRSRSEQPAHGRSSDVPGSAQCGRCYRRA